YVIVCVICMIFMFFFFFSSRRRHTRLVSDWSSDVCSSDLRSKVGHESLRRTKALHILNGTGESRRQGIYISLKGLIRSQLLALSISDAVSGDTLTIFRPQCPQKQP